MEREEIYKLFDTSKNISDVIRRLGVSDNSNNWKKIKELGNSVGFDFNIYKERKKKFCINCGKELINLSSKFCSCSCSGKYNNKNKVLSEETKTKISDSLKKYNKDNPKPKRCIIKREKKVEKVKINKPKLFNYCLNCSKEINKKNKYCSSKCATDLLHRDNYKYFLTHPEEFNRGNYSPKSFKDFFLNEQDYKCAVCHMKNVWNEKEIIFVCDHINGDSSDNRRENLRLVCPNCDSQLPTFKSKNKYSARRNYNKN